MRTTPNSSSPPLSHLTPTCLCTQDLETRDCADIQTRPTRTRGKNNNSRMPRMKTIEFSGYHPQGKKRSFTEAYYMGPSSDSSFAGIELEVQLHDLTKRRRTVRAS